MSKPQRQCVRQRWKLRGKPDCNYINHATLIWTYCMETNTNVLVQNWLRCMLTSRVNISYVSIYNLSRNENLLVNLTLLMAKR